MLTDEKRTSRLLTRKNIYPGRAVKLDLERVELPNGHVTELEIIHHPGAAAVIPLTDDDEVVLVRQFRHAVAAWLLEAPAGKLDPGETPEQCAMREAEEETGYRIGSLERLGQVLTAPGFCDEVIHLFVGRGLTAGRQRVEESEVLTVERVPFDEAISMVRDGRIHDAKTVATLCLAHLSRG